MENYSLTADVLSKFEHADPIIQALWIISACTTVLGITWVVTRAAVEITYLLRRPKTPRPPRALTDGDWKRLKLEKHEGRNPDIRELVKLVYERTKEAEEEMEE